MNLLFLEMFADKFYTIIPSINKSQFWGDSRDTTDINLFANLNHRFYSAE